MDDTGQVTLIMEPTVIPLADMQLDWSGVQAMAEWLEMYRPECLDGIDVSDPSALFPHDLFEAGRRVTDNELLIELSGRKCYNSFGLKAGRKTNAEYIANLFGQPGKIPHASVLYCAKMSFFFAGIGRRVSHELIRHYVGADREEEGSPSQESTRYTHHPGHFTVHPRDVEQGETAIERFRGTMQAAYDDYLLYLSQQTFDYEVEHGKKPQGMDRKRIYECAAQRLPGAAATSFIWTTNPMALAKLFKERCDYAADLEIQRFATKLRDICYARWPNAFAKSNPHLNLRAKE